MLNPSPLVSIIVPLFNREVLVRETVASVQAQTYPHWECVIVDDGSTDNSLNVVQQLAEEDTRIRVFERSREPKGAPTCRNIGLENASGDFIMFLDSDDLLAEMCLERRLEVSEKHPDYDFLIFQTLMFEKKPFDKDILWNHLTNDQDHLQMFLDVDVPWCITSPLWRKEAIQHLQGFDEKLLSWQDWELHIRAILDERFRFKVFRTQPDTFVRMQAPFKIGGSSSNTKHLESHFKLFNKITGLSKRKSTIISDSDKRFSLAGLYFWLALQWKTRKKSARGVYVWLYPLFHGLINLRMFMEGALSLYLRNESQLKTRLKQKIYRDWPEKIHTKFGGEFRKAKYHPDNFND